MFEWFTNFYLQVYAADTVVWTIAILLSIVAGHILNSYADDLLLAAAASFGLFGAIMIGEFALVQSGITFIADKNANTVAAAGATMCMAAFLVVVIIRAWHAVGALTHRLRGEG